MRSSVFDTTCGNVHRGLFLLSLLLLLIVCLLRLLLLLRLMLLLPPLLIIPLFFSLPNDPAFQNRCSPPVVNQGVLAS